MFNVISSFQVSVVDKKTGEIGYRPYLFKDRTLLASRVARQITETSNAELLYEVIDRHSSYIKSFISNTASKSSSLKKKRADSTTLLQDFNLRKD